MLYMVVANHSPEICPVHNQETRKKSMSGYQRQAEVAKKLNITSQGSWTYLPGHLIYMVDDAPNAHAVSQMALEIGLMDWNTVTIYPVVTVQEAINKLQ